MQMSLITEPRGPPANPGLFLWTRGPTRGAAGEPRARLGAAHTLTEVISHPVPRAATPLRCITASSQARFLPLFSHQVSPTGHDRARDGAPACPADSSPPLSPQ